MKIKQNHGCLDLNEATITVDICLKQNIIAADSIQIFKRKSTVYKQTDKYNIINKRIIISAQLMWTKFRFEDITQFSDQT